MEQQLRNNDYVAGGAFNIADIALFAYTHASSKGGFDLDYFPDIRNWIERIESRSRHIPMVKK
jgi:glutathione S-transferase